MEVVMEVVRTGVSGLGTGRNFCKEVESVDYPTLLLPLQPYTTYRELYRDRGLYRGFADRGKFVSVVSGGRFELNGQEGAGLRLERH
jgi:hypothetical protein